MDTFVKGKITKLWEAIYFVFITICESGGAGWKRWSALSTCFNVLIASVPHILISHFSKSKLKLHLALPEKGRIMDSYYIIVKQNKTKTKHKKNKIGNI